MAGFLDPLASLPPIPVAVAVSPVAAGGVSLVVLGINSFDVPDVPASRQTTAELSINPIIGDSGADRVVASGSLCTQLRMSWT